RLAQARRAVRRGRSGHAAEARRRVRQDGRALRVDRHPPCISAGRVDCAREAGTRDRAAMSERVFVEHEEADAFAKALLTAHGVPKKDAATVAACLVRADLPGVDTHGLMRLPGYLDRARRGLINPRPKLFPKQVEPAGAA